MTGATAVSPALPAPRDLARSVLETHGQELRLLKVLGVARTVGTGRGTRRGPRVAAGAAKPPVALSLSPSLADVRLGNPFQHQLHRPPTRLPQKRPRAPRRLPSPAGQGKRGTGTPKAQSGGQDGVPKALRATVSPGAALHGPGLRLRLPARRAVVDGAVWPGAGEGSGFPSLGEHVPTHILGTSFGCGVNPTFVSPPAARRQHPAPLPRHPPSRRHQPGSPIIIIIIITIAAATPAPPAPRRRVPPGDIPPPPVPSGAGIKKFWGRTCVWG